MDLKFSEEHCFRYDEASHITRNSELYKALDISLIRNVALKKVRISGETPKDRENNLKYAFQEVKTMVQIGELTTRIPRIYSSYYDHKENELFIVMQWIEGETLADKIKNKIPLHIFLRWMRELCGILDAMSSKHFQHKDIKPENIMFDSNDNLFLIDFNISVSAPNQMEGTLYYKAPEMDMGSVTVARDKVDMFSVGVIMYQYITGRVPARMIDYDCYDPAVGKWDFYNSVKMEKPEVPDSFNNMITKLMSYSPDDRYRNYKELINCIRNVEREIKNGRGNNRR